MILFREDWDKYPKAIIDLQTSSVSALKLATVYKRMGIKNNAFHLQLFHSELSGINVYKETSDEIKELVISELSINPFYYFREIARAPASGGASGMPFRLNRANVALYFCFFNHLTSILIMARQCGKSLSLDQLNINLLMYTSENANMGLLTRSSGLRAKNIESIKELLDALPDWLDFRTRLDSNNTEEITIKALNNKLSTAVAQGTKAGAMQIFRGDTKPVLEIDEAAFITNIDLTLGAMLPAMGAARDNAAAAGLPYGINFATTAGYLSTDSGKYIHDEVYSKAARFSESMFDCQNIEELYKVVAQNGHGSMNIKVLIEMNHRDVGHDDDWLRRKISESMVTKSQAEAEFLLIWNKGSDKSALSDGVIKRLNSTKRDPNYVEMFDSGFRVNWYISEERVGSLVNVPFVIGIDSSDAIGNDGISFIIRDYKSGVVIGAGNYNLANLDDFGYFVYEFLIKYIKSMIVIESRSSAMGILDQVANLLHASNENIFKRVFNWVVSDRESHRDKFRELSTVSQRGLGELYIKCKKQFGYSTSGSGATARSNLYGRDFESYVSSVAEYIYDKTLVHQLTRLVEKNGRIDHPSKKNDDAVIGFLLVSWFLHKGRNLQYYGIDPALVLTTALDTQEDNVDKKQREEEQKNAHVVEDISKLLILLKETSNPTDAYIIESRIKLLKTKLTDSLASKNIDARINDSLQKIQGKKKESTVNLNNLRWQ